MFLAQHCTPVKSQQRFTEDIKSPKSESFSAEQRLEVVLEGVSGWPISSSSCKESSPKALKTNPTEPVYINRNLFSSSFSNRPTMEFNERLVCNCQNPGTSAMMKSTVVNLPDSLGHQAEDELYYEDAKEHINMAQCVHDRPIIFDFKRSVEEFENDTIQKQRQELQLLVAELRNRNRELNETVAAHQRHLASWDNDRQRIIVLEEKCSRLERELQNRTDDIHNLTSQLRISESENSNLLSAVDSTRYQLADLTEQNSHTVLQLKELQQRYDNLKQKLRQSRSETQQLECREQELLNLISAKDREASETAAKVAELNLKLKRSDVTFAELRQGESEQRRAKAEVERKLVELHWEKEHLKRREQQSLDYTEELKRDVAQLKQTVSNLSREATLSSERDKRKEQLLSMQKSKQERTDAELTSLRDLCEKQQRDLSLLQLHLDSTKEMLAHQQKAAKQDSLHRIANLEQRLNKNASLLGTDKYPESQPTYHRNITTDGYPLSTSSFREGNIDAVLDVQKSSFATSSMYDRPLPRCSSSEMLPERENSVRSTPDLAVKTSSPITSLRSAEFQTAGVGVSETVRTNLKYGDDWQETASNVSTSSASIQLSGAQSSNVKSPSSSGHNLSGTRKSDPSDDDDDGRQSSERNRKNASAESSTSRRLDPDRQCDQPTITGDQPGTDGGFKRRGFVDKAATAAAAAEQVPLGKNASTDRCHSAGFLPSSCRPADAVNSVERLYYSANCSARSSCSSSTITPARDVNVVSESRDDEIV